MSRKIGLSTDCVCDLSNDYLDKNDILCIRFYLNVESGKFMDGYEISAVNVVEHYTNVGTKIISAEPEAAEYSYLFRKKLEECDELIHFTISSKISSSYEKAMKGKEMLGEDAGRVHVFDTESLSGGMAFLILKAVQMRNNGSSIEEIISVCEAMRSKIDVGFVAPNVHYLTINGRVEPYIEKICNGLKLHPIFRMKEGDLVPVGFESGKREVYAKHYILKRLKKRANIDDTNVYIVHSSCPPDEVNKIVNLVKQQVPFKNVYINKTSATVTCNSGEGAFGIIYMNK